MLDALDALWTTNPVQHDGARWSIPESWVDLKPVQRPRPPIYLGAFTPAGLKRVGERADGWMAAVQVPGGVRLDALNWQRQAIDDAARAAGRDPSAIHTYVRINVAEGTPVDQVADAAAVAGRQRLPRRVRRPDVRGDRNRRPPGVGGTAAGLVSDGLLASASGARPGRRRIRRRGPAVRRPRRRRAEGRTARRQRRPATRCPSVAGASIAFALHNANKRSAVLDPADAADRERLIELAGTRRHRGGRRQSRRAAAFGTSCAELPSGSATWSRCRSPTSGRRARTRRGAPPTRCCTRMSTALSRTGPTSGTPGAAAERGSRRRPRRCRPPGRRWPPTITDCVAAQAITSTSPDSRRSCSRSIRRSGPRARPPSG